MCWRSKLSDDDLVITALAALVLAAILIISLTTPTYGRWDVPQATDQPREARHSPPLEAIPLTPTPTTIPLPEKAEVPVLMYHHVSKLPSDADQYRRELTVSPEAFEEQLRYLDKAGYHTITLTDLYLHLTQGHPLPDKPVVLTFDDGYRDAYEVVFPLLLDRGFTGTFFVLATPAHFASPDYLTWAQMKEMSDAGMAIQAHGRDHVDLRDRPYEFLVYQILGIREAIEYHTDRLPRFFCYPSGRRDADVIAVVRSAGYWGAVTTEWGKTYTRDNLFEMPRLRVRRGETLESFVEKLEGE